MGKYNWEQRGSCLPGYATFRPSSPSLCLPLLPATNPKCLLTEQEKHLSSSSVFVWHCLSPVFFKLQKSCKCQATGIAEVCVSIIFPGFIFFPVGDRKRNCFGDHLSQCRSINTFPLCLFFLCCYECFSGVPIMPL